MGPPETEEVCWLEWGAGITSRWLQKPVLKGTEAITNECAYYGDNLKFLRGLGGNLGWLKQCGMRS